MKVNKSQAIRDVLSEAATPLSVDTIIARLEKKIEGIVNRKKIVDLLNYLQAKKDITRIGVGPTATFSIHRKNGVRSMAEIAKKISSQGGVSHASHLLTTFDALKSLIETDKCCPALSAALRSHHEAIQLASTAS